MASTTTQTSIANRALQIVGYKPIGSINDNDRGARAILRAYEPVRLAMLRQNYWGFSILRATLAAAAVPPVYGKANYFPLPGDYVEMAPPDQNPNVTWGMLPVPPVSPNSAQQYRDWQIEKQGPGLGWAVATNNPAPLYIRYVSSQVGEADFDPLFAEAFSARLALEVCEELTQSNTKLASIAQIYKTTMDLAKQRNAYEEQPVQPPVDSWILTRI